jgi:hypothetical protein
MWYFSSSLDYQAYLLSLLLREVKTQDVRSPFCFVPKGWFISHLLSSFEMLQEHKVWFFSLKENIDFSGPIGKLTFQIFGALVEFERETIKMRTREGKNASARRGNFVIPSPPFGYEKIQTTGKITKSLRIIPDEAEWVKKIFDMAIGGMTLNGIARHLNENKVWKGMGGVWNATSLLSGMGIMYARWSKIQVISEVLSISQKLKNEISKKYLSQYLKLSIR